MIESFEDFVRMAMDCGLVPAVEVAILHLCYIKFYKFKSFKLLRWAYFQE
jgi:hypothetical protein